MRIFQVVGVLLLPLTLTPAAAPPARPMWQRVLSPADARRAAALAKASAQDGDAGRFDDAVKDAQALVTLRERGQGADHWQAVDARWELVAWQRAGKAKKSDRIEYHRIRILLLYAARLQQQGQYQIAKPLFEKVLAIFRKVLGENHPYTGLGYYNVAYNLDAQGKHALAQPLHEKALAIRRKALGEAHPDTARSYSNVAFNLDAQGKHALAQPSHEKALAVCRKVLGEEHSQTAISYNSLALNLNKQGKHAQAQPLYEKALAIHRKVLGEEHYFTADSYNGVALNLYAQGKHVLAQPLFEKALAINRKVLGEEHPNTATYYNNVAANLKSQGKYALAQPLYEKALAIHRKVLGEAHPVTANSFNNVGVNLNAQGKHALAQPMFEKALAIQRKVLGEEHPSTALSINNLAANLNRQGKHALAQPLYEKALAIYRKLLGEEHPDTAQIYNNVASNLNAQGKHALAQPLHEKALAIDRKVQGEDHPDTARSYNDAATNLDAQGKHASAQPLFERALAICRKALGEEHPHTASSYNNLALKLNAQGKFAPAQPLIEKALAIQRKVLGEEHPLTALGYSSLAYNLNAQRKYKMAQAYYEKALAIYRKVLGEDHPDTANSYNSVAFNLNAQGKHALAQPLYEKALAIHRKVLGEEHPFTAICYTNAAFNLDAQGKSLQAEQMATRAAISFDRARLLFAPVGLERAARTGRHSPLPLLACLLAGNGKPELAWAPFEQGLARSTGEELAARLRWPEGDRDRLTSLRVQLQRLDRRIEHTFAVQNSSEDQLKVREGLLGERLRLHGELAAFQREVEQRHGISAGQVLDRAAIQKALPANSALLGWLDLEKFHWAVLLRGGGGCVWVRLHGSGDQQTWTPEDDHLPRRLRAALEAGTGSWEALARKLRQQRLDPLAKHLDGVRHLVVLPSGRMDGVPVEVLAGGRTVSYAPSGTLFAHLRSLSPSRNTILLALADPVFERRAASPVDPRLPPGGLLVTLVAPGSNAARAGLKASDVLLQYAEVDLRNQEQLTKLLSSHARDKSIALKFWRDGKTATRPIQPGALGIVLDRRPAREGLALRYKNDKVIAATRSADDGKWQSLPGTRVEVQALHKLLGDKGVTLLTDSQASQQKLDELASKGALRRYRFLHLATHGTADWRLPLHSALILSRDQLPDPFHQLEAGKPVYDGRLTAEEVLSKWKLDADLVTLSACQTALGKYERGEGFLGFAQALILAGSRSVVLSLWKVDDGATALLMERFYANLLGKRDGLKKPMPKAEALAEAKRWLRGLSREEALKHWAGVQGGVVRGPGRKKLPLLPAVPKTTDKADRPYAHPYYWAAFILVGRPD
jgi:tetratricopeptide (TPR) repeat protein